MMNSTMSSPLLKARKNRRRLTKRRIFVYLVISLCLMLLSFLFFVENRFRTAQLSMTVQGPAAYPGDVLLEPAFWPTNPPYAGAHRPHNSLAPSFKTLDLVGLATVDPIPAQSLTALLPVTSQSISNLEAVISSLLRSPGKLHHVIISCPEAVLSDARRITRKAVSAEGIQDHLELSLRPWLHEQDSNVAIMHAASEVTTDWVLILDDDGLNNMDNRAREMLLNPISTPLPNGPRGITFLPHNISCTAPSQEPQLASFVIPPFIMPYSLVTDISKVTSGFGFWADLGERISRGRLDGIGGIVTGADSALDWCHLVQSDLTSRNRTISFPDLLSEPDTADLEDVTASNHQITGISVGTFAILFPSLRDMRLFSRAVCRLQDKGHIVYVLLYGDDAFVEDPSEETMDSGEQTVQFSGCRLNYDTLSLDDVRPAAPTIIGPSYVSDWFDTLDEWPDVVIALKDQDSLPALDKLLGRDQYIPPSLILIPHSDLPYCEWMGSLSVEEWRNWNVPRVDISVITKDRPRSLDRLLVSLSNAKFFGDTLSLRINLEQTSDAETIQLVEHFRWDHGPIVVHHRVVHGGLLPAVVESWYPHSNNSYGLLLEDDVELSPLFYAWVKMNILRYRYGKITNKSPQLFGISLYQQKNVELNLEGRRTFDARALFSDRGLSHPSTPYLSQIPCSWGAVYFPEHWREFHEYLSVRLSEYSFSIDEVIVPDIRSNRWTKSWKKYFIELVYLRGYIMLYPNYANFVSFSTNHLEVGSHVKDRPNDVYLQRKELFLLPLMSLSDNSNASTPSPGILDLPNETLPPWHSLPILNLTGSLTLLEILIDQGQTRRTQLTGCSGSSLLEYDIRDLTCIRNTTFPL